MIRKFPLAFASFILGLITFLHLFGLEKAVFAVVLGGLALKSLAPGQEGGRKYAYLGIILGSLYILTLVVIAIMKGPEIFSLIKK
jgi:hypothetical protein